MAEKIVPIRSTTQSFIEVEDIANDIVVFADGSCALVVSTSAVNFGLLSTNEQDAIINAYAGLINSLSFPIQILVRTQHKDVTHYLALLEEREHQQKNPKLAHSIRNYRAFVAETVKEKDVLDKNFYIVVPFSSLELGASPRVLFGNKRRGLPYPKSYIFERAQTVLLPKRDHIIRLLNRVGLRAKQLTTEQLVKFFFSAYNPGVQFPEGPNAIADAIPKETSAGVSKEPAAAP
jgi:hypothetical protein